MKSSVAASLFPLRIIAKYPHIAALTPIAIMPRKFSPPGMAAASVLFGIRASSGLTFHNHITTMT